MKRAFTAVQARKIIAMKRWQSYEQHGKFDNSYSDEFFSLVGSCHDLCEILLGS